MLNSAEIHSELLARRKDYALSHALYCDDGVYAADLEQIWYREWLFAAPAAALPKAGAFMTMQVGAYPVVITRGNDGMIRAFHNVCRHRGQRLCAKETGSSPKLVCPYHQWTYDLDGKLQYARDMQEGFNPAEHGLKKVHCVDLGGMVFICLAQVPPPIAELAKTMPGFLAPSGLKDAKVAFSSTIVENGNWKLVIENNRECYHCGGSHPSLCRTFSDNPKIAAMNGPNEASGEILAHWTRCEAAGLPSRFTHDKAMQWRLARVPLLNNAESYTMDTKAAVAKRMGAMPFNDAGTLLFYHYPNTWNHFLGDHAITFRVLPISATETQVTTTWLVHKDAVEGVDYDLNRLTEVWMHTNDEDRLVVEENQKGILSPAYEPGPYSTIQEEGVIQFIDWYCNVMTERMAPKPALAAE
jgi:Rieske 2Fe-2S family protein